MSSTIANRPMGVTVKHAGIADEKLQYEPGTVVNIAPVEEYVVEMAGPDGKIRMTTIQIIGDRVYGHPASENWTRDLNQLPPSVEKKVMERVNLIRAQASVKGVQSSQTPIFPKKES